MTSILVVLRMEHKALCGKTSFFVEEHYKNVQLHCLHCKLCHCLHSDSASPKPGKRRRATLIVSVVAQCR